MRPSPWHRTNSPALAAALRREPRTTSEVIDAQTQLEIARDDRVAALFNYANARIDLAQATGTITRLGF